MEIYTGRREFVQALAAFTIPTALVTGLAKAAGNANDAIKRDGDVIATTACLNVFSSRLDGLMKLSIPIDITVIDVFDRFAGRIVFSASYVALIDNGETDNTRSDIDIKATSPSGMRNSISDQAGRQFYLTHATDTTIVHQRSPAAQVTSVHGKLRNIVFLEEDYGFGPDASPEHNARALQSAINDACLIYLPQNGRTCQIAGESIMLKPYTQLVGYGPQRSILRAQAPMVYETAVGHDEVGPVLKDFQLFCQTSGIRYNRSDGGFDDTSQSQKSVMRPRFERLHLAGPGANVRGTIGLELIKCFGALVNQCEITGFATGYRGEGSDLCSLKDRTRIWHCGTLIDLVSVDTFGSGTILDGLDLLNATHSFIRSSDRDLSIINCYLELSSSKTISGPVLDIINNYSVVIDQNRIEIPSSGARRLLSLSGQPVLISFCRNKQGGEAWGDIRINDGKGLRYYHNVVIRTRVLCEGNSYVPVLPMVTHGEGEQGVMDYRETLALTPATTGLLSRGYGQDVCVIGGAFVLPANNSITPALSFDCPQNTLFAKASVRVVASASKDTKLIFNFERDGAIIGSAITTIGPDNICAAVSDEIELAGTVISVHVAPGQSSEVSLRAIVIKAI